MPPLLRLRIEISVALGRSIKTPLYPYAFLSSIIPVLYSLRLISSQSVPLPVPTSSKGVAGY